MPIALVVHGGAWNIPDESVDPCLAGVRAALEHGWRALSGGADALDARLILVATDGRVSATFNTPRMARGWVTQHGGFEIHVEPTDVAR